MGGASPTVGSPAGRAEPPMAQAKTTSVDAVVRVDIGPATPDARAAKGCAPEVRTRTASPSKRTSTVPSRSVR